MIALETVDICKTFGGLDAVKDLSLRIQQGERHAILGPNGAGKTTLFHLISGFLLPSSGKIYLFGRDVTNLTAHKRAQLGLGRTFQITNLFPALTLFENILLAVDATQRRSYCFYRTAEAVNGIIAQTEDIVKEWELWEMKDAPVKNISYGEQRKVEIIIALARRPRLILLDEPTAGLSPAESSLVVSMIKKLPREITIIFIEHDMDVAFELAERITFLNFGSVLTEGSPDTIRGNAKVAEIYLG